MIQYREANDLCFPNLPRNRPASKMKQMIPQQYDSNHMDKTNACTFQQDYKQNSNQSKPYCDLSKTRKRLTIKLSILLEHKLFTQTTQKTGKKYIIIDNVRYY